MLRMKILSLLLVSCAAPSAWAGTAYYTVFTDTSSIAGLTGFLDFQFNPGAGNYLFAEAEVLNFDGGGGTLDLSPGVLFTMGNVLGDLPSTVTFYNYDNVNNQPSAFAVNDYSPGFTYGNSIAFDLRLTWQDGGSVDAPTSFFFSMLDDSYNPLLTTVPDGFTQATQWDLNPDLSTAPVNYSGAVTTDQVITSTTPEPSMLGPGMLAIAGLVLRIRRNRR